MTAYQDNFDQYKAHQKQLENNYRSWYDRHQDYQNMEGYIKRDDALIHSNPLDDPGPPPPKPDNWVDPPNGQPAVGPFHPDYNPGFLPPDEYPEAPDDPFRYAGPPSWSDGNGWRNPPPSPLVLDLDGDGIELTQLEQSRAFFDLDTNGFSELTAWVKADDGLLAVDRNGNGRIDDRTELFGALDPAQAKIVNGFTELAKLDTNRDGRITIQDTAFAPHPPARRPGVLN